MQVEGYTDNIGSDEYNLKLSQERATAVQAFLISQGVQPGNITAQGYGKASPVADNCDECRASGEPPCGTWWFPASRSGCRNRRRPPRARSRCRPRRSRRRSSTPRRALTQHVQRTGRRSRGLPSWRTRLGANATLNREAACGRPFRWIEAGRWSAALENNVQRSLAIHK